MELNNSFLTCNPALSPVMAFEKGLSSMVSTEKRMRQLSLKWMLSEKWRIILFHAIVEQQ